MKSYGKQKFMMTSPINTSDMYPMQGPAIIQNHMIVNINENNNINNYYNVIQGRKMDDEQNIIRMGRYDTDTNSKALLAKFKEGMKEQPKPNYKTMISKKLLNQAKQLSKKQGQRNGQQNHNTTAALISRQIDNATKTPVANHTSKDLHHPGNYQTSRQDRRKNKSQFDFEQLSRFKGGKENKNKAKVSLDLDQNDKSNIHDRSTILGMSRESERRRSTHGQNTTLGRSTNRQKQNFQTVKTSRPLAQAKQANGFSRHKRFKSEIKNGYKSQQNNLTQLVKQPGQPAQRRNPQTKTSRPKHNSTFENVDIKGAQVNTQFQNTRRQRPGHKRDEGISLSSGFSSASRSRGMEQNEVGTREGQSHLYESKQLAQQLNRTYFLNTKQLLRHLSPKKDAKQDGPEAQPANRQAHHKQSISQCAGKEGSLMQELSQRNTTSFRGRSKSTTHNFVNPSAAGTVDKRRNNSCSEQRSKARDGKQAIKHSQVVSRGDNQDPLHASSLSKSLTLGTSATPAAGHNSLGAGGKVFKHKVDKLIKQNIRKNQSKIEETLMRKQLEEFKQQQRKNNLSQRNKELRLINASRVVTSTQKETAQQSTAKQNTSIDNKSAEMGCMEVPKDRQRSQSCVDYKSIKGKTMESYRKPNRSQERNAEGELMTEQSRLQPQQPQKQIPLTTTNQANSKSAKQRSFVDEITKLTQQVERELGIGSSHLTAKPAQSNEQDLSSLTYKQQHSAQEYRATTKRTKRKDKMSTKVQKFIERKKREDMIKRSLERTIEVEKQQKIRQNLKNLDKFVQQHLRQKSQPSIAAMKKSIVNGALLQGDKKVKKIHKKNKKTQDQPIVGLSEIFYPDFPEHSNPDFSQEANQPDMTAKHISHERMLSQQTSLLDYTEQNTVIHTAGRGNKNKKPTSSSKSKRAKKSFNFEKTKDTTLGARTASGSGAPAHHRKASVPTGFANNKRSALNPSKQISVPLPVAHSTTEGADGGAKFNTRTQPYIKSKKLQAGEKSRWLEQKHPDLPEGKILQGGYMTQIPTQSDFNQTTQLALTNIELQHEKVKTEAKKPHRGPGKIRRIQELVSLYRCKFKPNVSDASIIGTLHSAASVIQIHFRYRRHLRDGQRSKPTTQAQLSNQSTAQPAQRQITQEASSKRKSDRKISTQERKSAKRSHHNKHESVPESDSLRVIRENLAIHENYEGVLVDANESAAFKEVRTSVFGASELEEQQAPTKQEAVVSPKELKFKRDKVQLKQQTNLEKMSNKGTRDQRKHSKLQLMLDIDQITNEHEQNTQTSVEATEALIVIGNKTPQIPGLDLDKLNKKEKKNFDFRAPDPVVDDPYGNLAGSKGANDLESNASQHTVSSYRGLFNRVGLPLPRSARVKVDYDLVQKDPKITEQLKEIVTFKEAKGKQVLKDGKKENLISERTYQLNVQRLERWVTSNHRKIQDHNQNQVRSKPKIQTRDQLLQDSVDGRERLNKLMQNNIDLESSRQHSHMSQSWRAPGPRQTDSRSQTNLQQDISSKRLSDVHVLPRQTQQEPETSNHDEDASVRLEDIQIHNLDNFPASDTPLDFLPGQKEDSRKELIQTDKSLNRSISYPTIQNKDSGMHESQEEDQQSRGMKTVDPSDIELQLEDALENQKRKQDDAQSPLKEEKSQSHNMDDIRDPRFFMRKVDDEQVEDVHGHDFPALESEPVITFAQRPSNQSSVPDSEQLSDNQPAPSLDEESHDKSDTKDKVTLLFGAQADQGAIKVENQQPETKVIQHESSLGETAKQTTIVTQPQPASEPQLAAPNISSPLSDGQSFEFCKIQTGAHSLSSTDSDMAKAIKAANKDILESPPNLISPKSDLENVVLQANANQDQQQPEHVKLADDVTDLILSHLLREVKEEIPVLVQRPQLAQNQRPGPTIKFFDKKGIKTDLFAIEKYVDEVLEEVKQNRPEFMAEINKPHTKDPLQNLFQMQNSEIGSYEHFQSQNSSVLSLDLYLQLEKRRKESRENPTSQPHQPPNPDGLFDFDKVADQEPGEEAVNKNFLAECQHIHNKVLFDCINESLQQFRPHGKEGAPVLWSTAGRKLKPTEDFTLEEMFEITKHDLFRMAIVQAGTLPRREFVFNHQFDDELFAEIREKKLATLLCREIVETEPTWLKWDFEEAQTKIDIGDMVLEALVTETIEFLNSKNPKSQAQQNFEEIQEMIKSRQ